MAAGGPSIPMWEANCTRDLRNVFAQFVACSNQKIHSWSRNGLAHTPDRRSAAARPSGRGALPKSLTRRPPETGHLRCLAVAKLARGPGTQFGGLRWVSIHGTCALFHHHCSLWGQLRRRRGSRMRFVGAGNCCTTPPFKSTGLYSGSTS